MGRTRSESRQPTEIAFSPAAYTKQNPPSVSLYFTSSCSFHPLCTFRSSALFFSFDLPLVPQTKLFPAVPFWHSRLHGERLEKRGGGMSGWSVRCPETGKAIALVHLGAPLSDPALRKVLKSHCRAQRRAAHNALHLSFQRCWYSAESPSRYLANSPGIARKAPRDRGACCNQNNSFLYYI